MVKATFLLPLTFNDGTRVPKATLLKIYDELFAEVGNHTIGARLRGAYKMASGEKQVDLMQQVWVVIEKESLPILKQFLQRLCTQLDQETIYLEVVSDAFVEFIGPAPAGEQHNE